MPAQPFSVHVDPTELAKRDLAAAVSRPSAADTSTEGRRSARLEQRHGARDERQAARSRSERERSGRAAGAAGGRSYAFRRS